MAEIFFFFYYIYHYIMCMSIRFYWTIIYCEILARLFLQMFVAGVSNLTINLVFKICMISNSAFIKIIKALFYIISLLNVLKKSHLLMLRRTVSQVSILQCIEFLIIHIIGQIMFMPIRLIIRLTKKNKLYK